MNRINTGFRRRTITDWPTVCRVAVLAFFVSLGLIGIFSPSDLTARSHSVYAGVVTIDGVIQSTTAKFLSRAIDNANKNESAFLIVRLNTPGGLLESTRKMVETIMSSPIPIVVYVAPQGGQAASAGTFILAAGHVAAMAPSTNVGAASPISGTGEDLPETLRSKTTEDTAAFLRSIGEERGRNPRALEQTVLNAEAYTAVEALELGIIEFTATDVPDLLIQLDGHKMRFGGQEISLATDNLSTLTIGKTPLEHFLGFLASPNIAFLFLSLGALGIAIELFNIGTLVPGIIGGILLALGLVGVGNLPVNWAAFGLLAFAMLLFYLEIQAVGFGIFGVGGIASFFFGAFFLFGRFSFSTNNITGPDFRVSFWLIILAGTLMFGVLAIFLWINSQARKTQYVSDVSSLKGRTGSVMTDLSPRGTVEVNGELWTAFSLTGEIISENTIIVVEEISGVTLTVRPTDIPKEAKP